MIAVAAALTPFYCDTCGRMEDVERPCPVCGCRRQSVSRYEWALSDAISDILDRLDVDFSIVEQWQVPTKHVTWHFDLWVEIRDKQTVATVIEVNAQGHDTTAKRDDLKFKALPRGVNYVIVANEDCRAASVLTTARRLLAPLLLEALR